MIEIKSKITGPVLVLPFFMFCIAISSGLFGMVFLLNNNGVGMQIAGICFILFGIFLATIVTLSIIAQNKRKTLVSEYEVKFIDGRSRQ